MNTHINAFPIHRGPSWLILRGTFGLALTIILFSMAGCATTRTRPRPPPVTVTDVEQMLRADVPTEEIIAKMRASRTVYRFNAAQLAHLKNEGVPNRIINYMQRTYLRAVRRHQAAAELRYWTQGFDGYWYGGEPYGWPDGWTSADVFAEAPTDDSGIERRGMEHDGNNGGDARMDDRGDDQ